MPKIATKGRPGAGLVPSGRRSGNGKPFVRPCTDPSKVGKPTRRPVAVSDRGKVTTRSLSKAIARELPGLSEPKAKRVWRVAMRLVRQAIMEGKSVVLEELCTVIPYVKAKSRGYNPFFKKQMTIPATNYIRFETSVGLVKDLKATPVSDTASTEK